LPSWISTKGCTPKCQTPPKRQPDEKTLTAQQIDCYDKDLCRGGKMPLENVTRDESRHVFKKQEAKILHFGKCPLSP